jgi:hypothetical protein
MWLFHFWKIFGFVGIHRLIVLYIAEITARSFQAMPIWVSFMYIKYTHTHPMYLISNSTELCWCEGGGEASWQQLQRIAKLTHECRIPIQKQTCSCETDLELIVMRRLISNVQYIVQLSYRVRMRNKNLYHCVSSYDHIFSFPLT